jgi:cellulose biosynthesis protein BcsQ
MDFKETIKELKEGFGIDPEIKILITNYDARKKLHKEAVGLVKKHYKKELLKTKIRTCVALAESVSQEGKTIYEYSPLSHGAEDYNQLQKEIQRGIK